jgi:hypothetical protein
MPTLKKPVPSAKAVLEFAEGRGAPGKAKPATDAAATSRFPPSGDTRLTVNIRGDLHMRLKLEAVKQRTTVGELIEELVQQHVKG